MYEYIEGNLRQITEDAAIVDVTGIGFKILVSKACSKFLPEAGKKVLLWVSLVIREDAHTLYGFLTKQEREFFCLLQQVSGIGPKVALNILGKASLNELADAISRKDILLLSSIPGVGKKLAERLSLELRERVGDLVIVNPGAPHSSIAQESVQALQTLGFSIREAREAVAAATKASPNLSTIEELIQYALTTRK
jgi:holliday junction DNA helicase RuvA